MAYEIPGFSFTLAAASDLSENPYRFVDINADGKAARPSAGGRVVGVQNNRPDVDEATTVVQSGISIVEAGGAVAAGASVGTDASGRAVTATSGQKIGIALDSAPGTGVFVTVLLTNH